MLWQVSDVKCVFLWGFKIAFGGQRSTGFGVIYDSVDLAKKSLSKHLLMREGLKEKPKGMILSPCLHYSLNALSCSPPSCPRALPSRPLPTPCTRPLLGLLVHGRRAGPGGIGVVLPSCFVLRVQRCVYGYLMLCLQASLHARRARRGRRRCLRCGVRPRPRCARARPLPRRASKRDRSRGCCGALRSGSVVEVGGLWTLSSRVGLVLMCLLSVPQYTLKHLQSFAVMQSFAVNSKIHCLVAIRTRCRTL